MSFLAHLRDLELRYDGPVPPQHDLDAAKLRRRQRGHAALLESQALAYLDAAVRCETEIEDLTDDPVAPTEQQVDRDRKRADARTRALKRTSPARSRRSTGPQIRGRLSPSRPTPW